MSSTTMNVSRKYLTHNLGTNAKLSISYIAAHLTAISTIGILYMTGLFDVGFLAKESSIVNIAKYLISFLT